MGEDLGIRNQKEWRASAIKIGANVTRKGVRLAALV
jgi:hypothetical protein